MSLDPATGVKTGLALYEAWQKTVELRLKLRRRLAQKRLALAIFGAGGVGKSTLGNFLDEKFDPLEPPKVYRASEDTEEKFLKTNPAQTIFVAPGQPERSGYVNKLLSDLMQTKRLVVMNLVAYGYHATVEDISVDVAEYFQRNRALELDRWKELTERLTILPAPIKLITVVVKEDLWYPNNTDVRRYYEQGEYTTILQHLRSQRGEINCPHEFIYVSLTSHNLADKSGKVLANIVEGYDDVKRHHSQEQLMNVLERFTRK
jgi:adenylate kinase family enzyme